MTIFLSLHDFFENGPKMREGRTYASRFTVQTPGEEHLRLNRTVLLILNVLLLLYVQ
jgi:hypothetical protein